MKACCKFQCLIHTWYIHMYVRTSIFRRWISTLVFCLFVCFLFNVCEYSIHLIHHDDKYKLKKNQCTLYMTQLVRPLLRYVRYCETDIWSDVMHRVVCSLTALCDHPCLAQTNLYALYDIVSLTRLFRPDILIYMTSQIDLMNT